VTLALSLSGVRFPLPWANHQHAPRGGMAAFVSTSFFLPGNVKNKAWEVLLDCCFWWCFMSKKNKQTIWPHKN